MELKFNKITKAILDDIALIQIESYNLILAEKLLLEDKVILEQLSSSLEEAKREAKWRISQYEQMIKVPYVLGIMDDSEITTMRHILFQMEEEYISQYGYEEVITLWENFFKIEENRQPKLRLIMGNLRLKKTTT